MSKNNYTPAGTSVGLRPTLGLPAVAGCFAYGVYHGHHAHSVLIAHLRQLCNTPAPGGTPLRTRRGASRCTHWHA